MTRDEVKSLMTDEESLGKVDLIMELIDDIARFGIFDSSVEMGIKYGPQDLEFTEFLLFKWIKEKRRNNV